MLDNMRSNDPIVITVLSGEFRIRFLVPYEIDILNPVEIDAMLCIFSNQLLTAHVINDMDAITGAFWRQWIVTGADFDAQAILIDVLQYLFFPRHGRCSLEMFYG